MTYEEFRANLLSLTEQEMSAMYALCRPYDWPDLESMFRRRFDLSGSLPSSPMTTERLIEALPEESRALFRSLVSLRTELARTASLPPYVICTNRTLYEMCIRRPRDPEELKQIRGIGKKNSEAYGDRFLSVIAGYDSSPSQPGPE